MPTYQYQAVDDDTVQLEFFIPIAEYERLMAGETYEHPTEGVLAREPDGHMVHPVHGRLRQRLSLRRTTPPSCYPYASDAMGCHPAQVAEMAREAERAGVRTNFTKDGRPIIEDRGHFRRFAEAFGYYSRNGGYGDPRNLKDVRQHGS